MIRFAKTDSLDPYRNLAFEETLLDETGSGDITLYLWQNSDTVVIGRSQNAWKECRCALLEEEGGRVARRTTGGGAVFHDVGNLNFSFAAGKDIYDEKRQTQVIIDSLKNVGVSSSLSGRNDILLSDGTKCSGCAYRHEKEHSLHHGTLLIDPDMDKMVKYLTPSRSKLAAKGVESVRSRVGSLRSVNASLTLADIADAVTAQFTRTYGSAVEVREADYDIAQKRERFASYGWIYGKTMDFQTEIEGRFPWGTCTVCFDIADGRISHPAIYTDSLDTEMPAACAAALDGELPTLDLLTKLERLGYGDIASLLREAL